MVFENRLLCDLGYRTLTHPSIKEKRVNEVAFQIFGIAIKNYNHALAFPLQIGQILERDEIAVVPIARGIQFLHETYGINTVLNVIMKDFIDKVNVPNPSNTTSKHLSMFLGEIEIISPSMSIQLLSDCCDELLDLEVYKKRL